jgi:hypothetical protein
MNLRRIEAFVLIGLGWHKECSVPNLCIEIRDNDHQVRNKVRQVSLPIDPDTTTNRSFSIIRKLFFHHQEVIRRARCERDVGVKRRTFERSGQQRF